MKDSKDLMSEQAEDLLYACETKKDAERVAKSLVKNGAMTKAECRRIIEEMFEGE